MSPIHSAVFLIALTFPAKEDAQRVGLTRLELLAYSASLKRFPSPAACNRWLERSECHLDWIDGHIALFPETRCRWQAYREQVVFWRGVWGDLLACRTGCVVREDLIRMQRIKAAIGEKNYEAGFVPPPIASYLIDTSK